jgi:hypothetical protein
MDGRYEVQSDVSDGLELSLDPLQLPRGKCSVALIWIF